MTVPFYFILTIVFEISFRALNAALMIRGRRLFESDIYPKDVRDEDGLSVYSNSGTFLIFEKI